MSERHAPPSPPGRMPARTAQTSRVGRGLGRGVVAVEVALVLPLLIMLLIGIVDFGILLYNKVVLANAAREGARWGIISSNYTWGGCTNVTTTNAATPCDKANAFAANVISFGTNSVPSTSATGSGTAGATVTVTTSFTYAGLLFSFSPFSVGGSSTLSEVAKMSHE